MDPKQLSLDDLADDEPEGWDEWFASLTRILGEPPPEPRKSEERDAA